MGGFCGTTNILISVESDNEPLVPASLTVYFPGSAYFH
jgi:hypothetical protein